MSAPARCKLLQCHYQNPDSQMLLLQFLLQKLGRCLTNQTQSSLDLKKVNQILFYYFVLFQGQFLCVQFNPNILNQHFQKTDNDGLKIHIFMLFTFCPPDIHVPICEKLYFVFKYFDHGCGQRFLSFDPLTLVPRAIFLQSTYIERPNSSLGGPVQDC